MPWYVENAAQTEITLGQYKKPSADKLEPKNVWFVRLNFDYADLGQLQITAELMDKSLDCQLLASSQEVSAIAHPIHTARMEVVNACHAPLASGALAGTAIRAPNSSHYFH